MLFTVSGRLFTLCYAQFSSGRFAADICLKQKILQFCSLKTKFRRPHPGTPPYPLDLGISLLHFVLRNQYLWLGHTFCFKTLDPAVHGRGRRRLRCACWWHTSIMGGYYVSMNASCADDQNLKIVRCSTFQGRWYPDFWRVEQNPLNSYFFFNRNVLCISKLRFLLGGIFLPCRQRCSQIL